MDCDSLRSIGPRFLAPQRQRHPHKARELPAFEGPVSRQLGMFRQTQKSPDMLPSSRHCSSTSRPASRSLPNVKGTRAPQSIRQVHCRTMAMYNLSQQMKPRKLQSLQCRVPAWLSTPHHMNSPSLRLTHTDRMVQLGNGVNHKQ